MQRSLAGACSRGLCSGDFLIGAEINCWAVREGSHAGRDPRRLHGIRPLDGVPAARFDAAWRPDCSRCAGASPTTGAPRRACARSRRHERHAGPSARAHPHLRAAARPRGRGARAFRASQRPSRAGADGGALRGALHHDGRHRARGRGHQRDGRARRRAACPRHRSRSGGDHLPVHLRRDDQRDPAQRRVSALRRHLR